MIVYHGTTLRRARRICVEGFLPRKPSRRVWFARGRGYAEGRARVQARRAHDRPVVLTCDIDLESVRARLGAKRVFARHGNIAIDGSMPVTVLRSFPGVQSPTTPRELADWVNTLLGLKPHKGVTAGHGGIRRLGKWVANRLASRPDSSIPDGELIHLARQWLPDFFADVEVDVARVRAYRRARPAKVELAVHAPPPDPREQKALDLLEGPSPRGRARGLKLLAELEDPDLFDWCVAFLADESPAVRLAALRTMARCAEGDAEVIAPLASAKDKRIRAAAVAALARHGRGDAARWFERGLKDPEPCVRLAAASVLEHLEPTTHRRLFELALNDPNPQVAYLAGKLTAGKGFRKEG